MSVKAKKKPVYFVEWQDAHSSSGWHTKDEVERFIKKDRCICEEVGWILSETKDELVMAARRLKWAEEGQSEWGLIQKIPKAWIRKKKIWGE